MSFPNLGPATRRMAELITAVPAGRLAGAGPEGRGPFGPAVEMPADAPLLDRVVGLAGRDPAWSPV